MLKNLFWIKNTIAFTALLTLPGLVTQNSYAFTISTSSPFSMFSAHEEINRQALKFTEIALENEFDIDGDDLLREAFLDLDGKMLGTKGNITSNPIIVGNFSTDVPKTAEKLIENGDLWAVDLRKYYEIPDEVSWHKNPNGQNLHFLRNFLVHEDNSITKDGRARLQSAHEACSSASELILQATEKTVELWGHKTNLEKKISTVEELGLEGMDREEAIVHYRKKALFMLGHATHILQDSFSPAHADRSSGHSHRDMPTSKFKFNIRTDQIDDICYYEPSFMLGGLLKSSSQFITVTAKTLRLSKTTELLLDRHHAMKRKRKRKGLNCLHKTFDSDDSIWIRTSDQKERAVRGGWNKHEEDMWTVLEDEKGWKRSIWDRVGPIVDPRRDPNARIKQCKSNYPKTDKGKHKCINHVARLARSATMKYIIAVARHLQTQQDKVKKKKIETAFQPDLIKLRQYLVTRVFNGNANIKSYELRHILPNGIFQCDSLSKELGTVR